MPADADVFDISNYRQIRDLTREKQNAEFKALFERMSKEQLELLERVADIMLSRPADHRSDPGVPEPKAGEWVEAINELSRQWAAQRFLHERERQLATELKKVRARLDEVRRMIVVLEKLGRPDPK